MFRKRITKQSRCRRICRTALGVGLLAALFAQSVFGAPHYFQHLWQTEQGLPENSVAAIVQSRNGYLWLGTYSGLVRFDGIRFALFDNSNTPQLKSSRITSLYEDSEGSLWIGHETGELTRLKDGMFEAIAPAQTGKARKISAIGADERGDIWSVSEDGLMTRVRDGVRLAPTAGGAPGQLTFALDASRHIWIVRQGKLSRIEQGKPVPVLFPQESPDAYVQGVCASAGGGVWISNDGKLRKWKDGKWTKDLGAAPWGSAGLSQFLELRNDCLAAGTVDSGLYLISSNHDLIQLNRTNGLPQNWIRSLCEDREGNLWVGAGSGGLVALREGKVATIDPPDHWQGHAVMSVSGTDENNLWIGTEGAGVYHRKNGTWEQFGESAGLSNLFVWSVARDQTGRIWVGTWGGGVFVEKEGHFERPLHLEDFRAPAQAILHSAKGVAWIGSDDGLMRYDDGKITKYGEAEGIDQPQVRTLVEDRDGTLWFGMFGGGLGRLREGTLKQFRASDGLSSDFVQCILLQQDGTIWLGTSDGGLTRMKDQKFATITREQGLADNVICHIEDDGQGYFWISSHAGIMRVSKAELNACADGKTNLVNCLTYGSGGGMPTLECRGGMQPSGCRTADGRLWFPTSKGLVVLDPKDVKKNLVAPRVVVEEFYVDGKLQAAQVRSHRGDHDQERKAPAQPGETPSSPAAIVPAGAAYLTVPPGRHRFDIFYTGLSFTVPEKVRFRYRLEGLDRDWFDTEKRSVNYSYIPPGEYTFRVMACNNDEVWSTESAAIGFKVLPLFWQTWWFRMVAGILGIAAVAAIVLAITRRRTRRKLEQLERQRAIERERTRIAKDIHDDLGASLTRITMLSQSARSDLDHSDGVSDLDRIYDTAREMTRAMDEIVWAVNPKHDTLDSLATYLGRFAQGFLAAAHVPCRLDVPMQLPAWPLTAEVRHNLFLAFKEALHNAVKHAKTSEVHISVTIDTTGFTLCVEDKGRGFDANGWQPPGIEALRPGAGNGLANMRQRLTEIGGRCEIESEPGIGTTVEFVVPVKLALA